MMTWNYKRSPGRNMNQESVKYEANCCPLGHIDIDIYVVKIRIITVSAPAWTEWVGP